MPDLLVDIEWNVMTGVQQMPLGVNLMIRYRSVGNLVFSNQQAVTKRTRERIHKIADNRSIERRIEREIEIIKDKETLTSGESKRKEHKMKEIKEKD